LAINVGLAREPGIAFQRPSLASQFACGSATVSRMIAHHRFVEEGPGHESFYEIGFDAAAFSEKHRPGGGHDRVGGDGGTARSRRGR